MIRPTAMIMAGGTGGHVFPALATARGEPENPLDDRASTIAILDGRIARVGEGRLSA